MRRAVIVAVVAIAAVGIGWVFTRDGRAPGAGDPAASATPAPGATSTSAPATLPAADAGGARHRGVRRLDPEAREQLGAQIAAARARAREGSGAAPGSGETMLPLERIAAPIREAMFEAVPILAECYKDRPPGTRTAVARMTLTSDPELGTVIDTEALKDENDAPLAPDLETCLRDTIDTLGLPPLDEVGGKAQLQYSFRFD